MPSNWLTGVWQSEEGPQFESDEQAQEIMSLIMRMHSENGVGTSPIRLGAAANVNRKGARAGIEDFHLHDLRHTRAAWLAQAGVPLAQIRDLLGHSTIKVTERYAHLAPENARGTVEVLDHESRFGHVGGCTEGKDPVLSALTS
jgi:hypothetical protein